MQCIFDQRSAKTAKTRFFPWTFTCFFKRAHKMQFKFAKLSLWPDFEKLVKTLIFGQKWPFLNHFLPPERGENWRPKIFFCKKVKLRAHTLLKSHYTSKLDHFWAHYLQKIVKNPYNVTTCNVFLTKIFPEISLVFFQK